MTLQALQLYQYHIWANRRVFARLRELPGDSFSRPVQSVFPSISEALAHLYLVDALWLSAMYKESDEQINTVIKEATKAADNTNNIGEMEALFAGLYEKYEAFFRKHEDLDMVTSYRHPTHGVLEASYADILQHIVNHGTYHRGNITAMMRQQGYPGASTDYVFYLYFKKA